MEVSWLISTQGCVDLGTHLSLSHTLMMKRTRCYSVWFFWGEGEGEGHGERGRGEGERGLGRGMKLVKPVDILSAAALCCHH